MSDATSSYLMSEVTKAQRTLRVALIAMGLIIVVFFGYFEWLKSELKSALSPESIAELAIGEARHALPEIGEALRLNVQDQAPSVVRFALHQAVDKVLPLLGQSFQASLDENSASVADITGTHASAAFSTVLEQYRAERAKTPGAHKPVTSAQLSSFVAARYSATLDDAAAPAMQEKLDQTSGTLKAIDARLAALAASSGGTREQELGRRLITTWWTFLDRGRPRGQVALVEPAKR